MSASGVSRFPNQSYALCMTQQIGGIASFCDCLCVTNAGAVPKQVPRWRAQRKLGEPYLKLCLLFNQCSEPLAESTRDQTPGQLQPHARTDNVPKPLSEQSMKQLFVSHSFAGTPPTNITEKTKQLKEPSIKSSCMGKTKLDPKLSNVQTAFYFLVISEVLSKWLNGIKV